MKRFNHILIVGGTGMLQKASVELARRSSTLTAIARTEVSLFRLGRSVTESGVEFEPLALDYRDSAVLQERVRGSIERHGPIDLVVAWIHSVAPQAPLEIARVVGEGAPKVDYYQVRGSSGSEPSQQQELERDEFSGLASVRYHRVILGFILEGSNSRWLSNDEISQGVLDAIASEAREHIVGVVRPWSMRP